MIGTTQGRMEQICLRTRRKRLRREQNCRVGAASLSLLLICGMGLLTKGAQTPGIATVHAGYGAVLIHSGVSAYVVVGIIAFAVGVMLSVLCIRLRDRHHNHSDHTDEGEEIL